MTKNNDTHHTIPKEQDFLSHNEDAEDMNLQHNIF